MYGWTTVIQNRSRQSVLFFIETADRPDTEHVLKVLKIACSILQMEEGKKSLDFGDLIHFRCALVL